MTGWMLVGLLVAVTLALAAVVVASNVRPVDARAASEAMLEPQVERARERGWTAHRYPEATWPPLLAADRAEPVRCDLEVDAGDAAAQTWTVRAANLLSPGGVPVHVHLVRVPAALPELLVRRFPTTFEYIPGSQRAEVSGAIPTAFRGRTVVDAHEGFLVAGDVDDALLERLAPWWTQIDLSGCFVVAGDDHLTLMRHDDPDGDELERRIGLARRLAESLGG